MTAKAINVNGRLLVFERPFVMGILNATPDSFYNAGKLSTTSELLKTAEEMVAEGANFLDIGGMSTKPGAPIISIEEEWQRMAPAIKGIKKKFSKIFLSVDTYRAEIARRAAAEGADIINDISSGDLDKEMIPTVAKLNLPYIAMHIQGTPQNMQVKPKYANVVREVLDYFIKKIQEIEAAGIKDVIIDPGFGFGKTVGQNYQLLKALNYFSILEKPMMVGLSRKSMIYKPLKRSPSEALPGTIALNTLALQNGADILRVHDVKEAMDLIRLWEYAKKN